MILLNDKEVKFKTYPNGETHFDDELILSFVQDVDRHRLTLKYQDDGDLIKLMFMKKYLDQTYRKNSELTIYYMPYSRMDRTGGEYPFTLKYVTDFINSLNFEVIQVIEPHSDVTPALLDNVISVDINKTLIYEVAKEVNFDKEKDYLFFPDAGAQKRYAGFWPEVNSLVGYKKRDFDTGRITNFQLVGETPPEPFKVIIMDDLSSYGGTFLLSAEHLRNAGATEVYLLVAHAEESILKGKVFESGLIDKVFTTDSIISRESVSAQPQEVQDKMKIFPAGAYMYG